MEDLDEQELEDDPVHVERKLLSALNKLPPMPDLSRHLNARNAKIISTLLVLVFIGYHFYLQSTNGSNSCDWLLSDGRFQGSMWQPYGCMMHTYTKPESIKCMNYYSYWTNRKYNYVVFMGDYKIRNLYEHFISIVDDDGKMTKNSFLNCQGSFNKAQATQNEQFTQPSIGLRVDYLPYMALCDGYVTEVNKWIALSKETRPTLIVTGTPLEFLDYNALNQNVSNDSTNSLWGRQLRSAVNAFITSKLHETTDIVWKLQDPFFDKNDANQTSDKTKHINLVVDIFNRAAIEIFDGTPVKVWKSSRLVGQIFQSNATAALASGLNITATQTEHPALDTQILLNYRCNGKMFYQDGTCCTHFEKPTILQYLTAAIFLICMMTTLVMFVTCHKDRRAAKTTNPSHTGCTVKPGGSEVKTLRNTPPTFSVASYEILKNLSRLGLILAYTFLCDRTPFFMKENKSYTNLNFMFPLGYVMLIGLFWAKESKYTTTLHRDQTDEWKGWMQLVILVYHYTGASQVLPIYVLVRCLVSTYIFLSAYGNFMYSFNTGDFSFHRFIKVLVRYNLLVVCLCMVMNRPYQFYYFVPLITYCYLTTYITLAMWPRLSQATVSHWLRPVWYMLVKVALLAAYATLLYSFEAMFEKIFLLHPIKPLFVSKDNTVHEWQFRWSIDRYSSIYGLLFAVAIVVANKFKFLQDHSNETHIVKNETVWMVSAFLSCAALLGYGILLFMCSEKQRCNNIHPYVSFIPICGYIFLRNCIGPIRALYSPFFAWFGRIALELFLAQYHIWLAADTNGILVLVPNYPIINVVVTTFIFVCAAMELHQCTTNLTHYLVPSNWKLLLRNLLIFMAMVIPMAIYSGAFNI